MLHSHYCSHWKLTLLQGRFASNPVLAFLSALLQITVRIQLLLTDYTSDHSSFKQLQENCKVYTNQITWKYYFFHHSGLSISMLTKTWTSVDIKWYSEF